MATLLVLMAAGMCGPCPAHARSPSGLEGPEVGPINRVDVALVRHAVQSAFERDVEPGSEPGALGEIDTEWSYEIKWPGGLSTLLVPTRYSSRSLHTTLCELFVLDKARRIVQRLPLFGGQTDRDAGESACEGLAQVEFINDQLPETSNVVYLTRRSNAGTAVKAEAALISVDSRDGQARRRDDVSARLQWFTDDVSNDDGHRSRPADTGRSQ